MARYARIGIVAGVPQELAAFHPDLPRTRLAGPLAIDRIEHGGRVLFLVCAGIGKVAAATAAATLHAAHAVDLLMVIGTAGRIAAVEGHAFLIDEAVQSDFGAQRAAGLVHYTAGTWPIGEARVTAFAALPGPELGLPRARIGTSDLFVECGAHAGRIRDVLGVTLVDMETAAVAQAAALLGLPWAAIKAATDGGDDDSAAAFVTNLAAAARASARAAEAWIERL